MFSEEAVVTVLGSIGCGAMLLNAKGRVIQTNERARRYLGVELDIRGQGFSDRRAPNGTIQNALRAALRASAELVPQMGRYIVVPRAEARPLILRCLALPDGPAEGAGRTVALILLDMEDCPLPDPELLRDIFLFTPAEVRLASRLSCGESLEDIAGKLGLSLGTVRVQLKSLFLKTGTRRQGELVALLAHLARLNAG